MNKIYKTFWDYNLGRAVVVSELGKVRTGGRKLLAVTLLVASSVGSAFACTASNQTELSNALSSACSTIELQGDISLNSNIIANIAGDVTINGNGYTLDTDRYHISLSGGSAGTAYDVAFDNFGAINSTNAASNAAVEITNGTSNINLKFDNIESLSESTLALLSANYSSGSNAQNPYSSVTIGNIRNPVSFSATTYKQFVNGAKINFTGQFALNGTGSGNDFSYIFWSNRNDNQNHINFAKGSDVTIKLDGQVKFSTGDGNGTGYAYHFADGSKFTLWSRQNVFGADANSNRGVEIGTYNAQTNTWGAGAVIQIAGVNGGQLNGDGLTNNGGNSLGVDNGANGTKDVVFNLAAGSNFNVTGAAINVVKNNTANIYVRSASDITAEDGIILTHKGKGDIVFANEGIITSNGGIGVSITNDGQGLTKLTHSGVINSNNTGIELLSADANTMNVDLTGGLINATGGSAIRLARDETNTKYINSIIKGGTIELKGAGAGIDFSRIQANTNQVVDGLTVNLYEGKGGTAFYKGDSKTSITLKDTHVSVFDQTAYTSLTDFTFADSAKGPNTVTVQGSGIGVVLNNNLDMSTFKDENTHLNIDVTSDTGTAVKIDGGTGLINVSSAVAGKISAANGTAIEVAGTVGRQININENVTLNGSIKFTNGDTDNLVYVQTGSIISGGVTFGNGSNDITLDSNSKITGKIIAGDGSNTLALSQDSSVDEVVFGNGNNTVNINGNVSIGQITMGIGDDTVKISDVNSEEALQLGSIDAGGGTNKFELKNSKVTLSDTTKLTQFSTYDLQSTSLTLQSAENIQSGTINIQSGSVLANQYEGKLSANLTGSGTLSVLDKANVNLTGTHSGFTGNLVVDGSLQLNNINTLNNTLSSSAAKLGTLVINNTKNTDKSFTLASNKVDSSFKGTFDLVGTTFDLSGDNTTALANSTLKVSEGTVVAVGQGEQNIGGLVFNGGQMNFHNLTGETGEIVSNGTINADNLDLTGSGVVSVNVGTALKDFNPNANPTNKSSVFEMDDDNLIVQLVKGEQVIGSAGQLVLTDDNGATVSDDTSIAIDFINSTNNKNAEGTFNFRLAGTEDGLFVNYGLTELKLLGTGVNAFDLILSDANNNGSRKNDLSAKITGAGDLRVNATDGAIISLSSGKNDYTGKTFVDSGTLSLAADNALGETSELALKENTSVLLNGTEQTVGEINTAKGSDIQFAGGQLTITSGGEIAGILSGLAGINVLEGNLSITSSNQNLSGTVVIGQEDKTAVVIVGKNNALGSSAITLNEQGTLNYDGAVGLVSNTIVGSGALELTESNLKLIKDNSGFSGSILIDEKSQLSASSVKQLGNSSDTNTITNDGNLTFTSTANDYSEVLTHTISGKGDFVKTGNGILVFDSAADLKYTGATDINAGTLYLDGTTIQSENQLTIAKNATLQGFGEIGGSVINNGTLNIYDKNSVSDNQSRIARADATGVTLDVNHDLTNNGHIILQESVRTIGNTLNIKGNYIGGEGSLITLAARLGIDDATSNVPQLIIGGDASGRTDLVVTNISGNGGQTTGQGILLIDVSGISTNDAFRLSNTVVDGAYEYTLQKGSDNSWYLKSFDTYRPDYGNNLANTLSIIDQQGNQTIGNVVGGSGGIRSADRLRSGHEDKLSSIWNITTYGKKQGNTASKQINYDYETKNTLFGADTGFFIGDGLLQVGGMVGLVKTTSNSHNLVTGSHAKGEVKGTQYSIYGTWYFDANTELSPFVDFIVSYGRYKNKINMKGNDQSSYRSHLYTYTLQGGYPIQLGENLIVEPQAQLTYVDYKIKDYTDHTGATVKQSVDGKLRSRIGAYIYPNNADFRPYAAVNLWYDDLSAKAGYNGVALKSDKRKAMIEGKLGLEANLTQDFSLSAEANYIRGKNQYKDYSVRLGLKYKF